MSDKAIIATDMPESCDKCKFMYEFYGVKKCQLLNVLKNGGKAIICVDKLNVARKECCPLTSLQQHDKEIRNKAISSFADWCYINGIDFSYMSTSDKSGRQFIDDVIARYCKEQMKEERENELVQR